MMWFQRQKLTTMADREPRKKNWILQRNCTILLFSSLLGEHTFCCLLSPTLPLCISPFYLSLSLSVCVCRSLKPSPDSHFNLLSIPLFSLISAFFPSRLLFPSCPSFSKHGNAFFFITGALLPLALPLFLWIGLGSLPKAFSTEIFPLFTPRLQLLHQPLSSASSTRRQAYLFEYQCHERCTKTTPTSSYYFSKTYSFSSSWT